LRALTVARLLGEPKARKAFLFLVLFVLAFLGLELRLIMDIDGVLDIDTINFGLAALRFDLLHHQPHPPGYPGYVVLLKAVHLAAPWLAPIDIAKWTCRLASVACIPAAYWLASTVLASGRSSTKRATPALWRPLAAAFLATVHPLLWYFGGDGQSHAAEALGTLILLGLALRVRVAGASNKACMGLAALIGLGGSLRPTLIVVMLPVLVWVLWGRPLRQWALAALAGTVAVASWFLPLLAVCGGWNLYSRATRALVQDLFFSHFSLLGKHASTAWILLNLNKVFYGSLLALLPFLAWVPSSGETSHSPWRRMVWIFLLANLGFYVLTFAPDLGYFTGLAALSTLVPAAWPEQASHLLKLRLAMVLGFVSLYMPLGPRALPCPFSPGEIDQPTLSHTFHFEKALALYRDSVVHSQPEHGLLLLTDNIIVTHTRWLPLWNPNVVSAVYLFQHPYNRALDNWLIYTSRSMMSLPTQVPLEAGPPAEGILPFAVARVMVGQDASEGFFKAVAASATCAPFPQEHAWPDSPAVWPATCVPELRLGQNRLVIPSRS
jgi:hypothetical protein